MPFTWFKQVFTSFIQLLQQKTQRKCHDYRWLMYTIYIHPRSTRSWAYWATNAAMGGKYWPDTIIFFNQFVNPGKMMLPSFLFFFLFPSKMIIQIEYLKVTPSSFLFICYKYHSIYVSLSRDHSFTYISIQFSFY